MFDIAWSELALIGAVALIVIGPKDLPKVMRVMGQWTRKARLLAGEFQNNFDELLRQAELDEVRRQVQSVNPTAFKEKVENMIDPKAIEAALRVDPPAIMPATPAPAQSLPQPQSPQPEISAPTVSVATPPVDATPPTADKPTESKP